MVERPVVVVVVAVSRAASMVAGVTVTSRMMRAWLAVLGERVGERDWATASATRVRRAVEKGIFVYFVPEGGSFVGDVEAEEAAFKFSVMLS